MKYVVILGDGMADMPVKQLNNKTPLQCANIPTINDLATKSELGQVKTVPDGIAPGSDVANLSVLGYNPFKYYTGRSPLEAVSMGIGLLDTDITFRCNLVTLSEDEPYIEKIMLDHSADEITTEEATQLIQTVNTKMRTSAISFYPGISYRHLMVWQNGPSEFTLTPPHDILEQKIISHMPQGPNHLVILDMMQTSFELLKNHPINIARMKRGLRPANAIWIWGEGKKPQLGNFTEKFGVKGAVISAVDLIKGIGINAGLTSIDVEGATGNINTNFVGKAEAAIEALESGHDFVYVHIEAPDECGHRQEIENKVKSIELIDKNVVKVIKDKLDAKGMPYKMMILPDHPTPLALRTHTSDPVPFLIYQSDKPKDLPHQKYDEFSSKKTGLYVDEGYKLMKYFIQ